MLISTPGSPSANSYVSANDIEDVFGPVIHGWNNMTDEEKENVVKQATADINRLRFLGLPYYKTQKMAFPRKLHAFSEQQVFKITDFISDTEIEILETVVKENPLPDYLKGGSVIIFYEDGEVTYHDIISNNAVTGKITFTPEKRAVNVINANVHPPVFQELKDACVLQAIKRTGSEGASDPNVGKGILRIKIGDSERSYANTFSNNSGTRLLNIAARNNVSEQVLVLIGHLTVYGKMPVQYIVDHDLKMEGLMRR